MVIYLATQKERAHLVVEVVIEADQGMLVVWVQVINKLKQLDLIQALVKVVLVVLHRTRTGRHTKHPYVNTQLHRHRQARDTTKLEIPAAILILRLSK